METTEKLDSIYEKFKNHFPQSSFHDVLWQLLINEVRKGKQSAFTAVIKDGYTLLAIADKNEKGYTPTNAIFSSDNYDECEDVCDELNKEVFGLTDKEASNIVLSSL